VEPPRNASVYTEESAVSRGLLKHLAGRAVGLTSGVLILGWLTSECGALDLAYGQQVAHAEQIKRGMPAQQPSPHTTQSARDLTALSGTEGIEGNAAPVVTPLANIDVNADPSTLAEYAGSVSEVVELPKRDSSAVLEITRIPGLLDIRLRNPDENHCTFQVSRDDQRNTWGISDGGQTVATLARQGDIVQFRWNPHAPLTAEGLRNVVLSLRAPGSEKKILLRRPTNNQPAVVSLAQPLMAIPLDLELWGLDPGTLQLEIEEVTSTPSPKRYEPDSRRCAAGKKVRVVLRDQAPCAALDVGITTVGSRISLNICPLLVGQGDELPWTIDRVSAILLTLNEDLRNANATIPQFKQDIVEAKKDIQTLQSIAGKANDVRARSAQKTITSLNDRITAAQANLAAMQRGVRGWPEQIKVLNKLADLGKQIHQRARIALRIFFVVDGQEVDVYRAG
jgi:hypothetical protein